MRYIIAILLVFTATAQARLGETPTACTARYGEPWKVDKEGMTLYFRKAGMFVAAKFTGGLCDMLMISKEERGILNIAEEMSETEIEAILQANIGTATAWKERKIISINKEWVTDNGLNIAVYYELDHNLIVSTRACLERLKTEKADKEKKKLEGF